MDKLIEEIKRRKAQTSVKSLMSMEHSSSAMTYQLAKEEGRIQVKQGEEDGPYEDQVSVGQVVGGQVAVGSDKVAVDK